MKRIKLIYRITTLLTVGIMGSSGVSYLLPISHLVEVTQQLGYPLYLMALLGVAKLWGVLALLVPGYPRVREWAYAGFVILLIGATWSHVAINDFAHVLVALFWLGIVVVSYVTNNQLYKSTNGENPPASVQTTTAAYK